MANTFASELVLLILRYSASYIIGIAVAAVVTSNRGGFGPSLILDTLAVGAPFFLAAFLLGLVFRKHVARHPISWVISAIAITALIWFPLAKSAGPLFDATRLGLYATFCAVCCGLVFLASTRIWRLR